MTNTGIAGMDGAYEMKNPANHLRAYVSASEMRVLSLDGETGGSWQLGLKLVSYGHGDNLSAVEAGEIKTAGNRVEISRDSRLQTPDSRLTEWYENSARGIEQGFEIAALDRQSAIGNPQSKGEPLRLVFEVSGSLRAQTGERGQQVGFSDERTVLVYEKLAAWDAKGRTLDSHMELEGGRVALVVEDEGAEYPLRIDPLLREQTKITASDGAPNDRFGQSVAISGDTVVVGAYQDDVGFIDQGSAYVFVRSGTAWTQQQKLTASDGAVFDLFGYSVAISGDTVVVGAVHGSNQGSAYVFVRSGTTWTQQAKLTASDGAAGDEFGFSVGISGDTLVVGAHFDDGANANQGSAYVFVRSGTTWTQQAKLTASDGAASDVFGFSVAISGDSVAVGAPSDDIAANPDQGSVYVFVRSGTTWTQQAKLTASDGAASDVFGFSVAISGDTVAVGAPSDDIAANPDQGSVYVFVRSGVTWTQQAQLTASDGASFDNFGYSVAISGETAVVGASADDVSFVNQGSAYVFVRSGTTWTQQANLLTASDGAESDLFAHSVAISGDTVVVGAYVDDVGAPVNVDQGSAYIFICNWDQQRQLTVSDGLGGDQFGYSVAISGDSVAVGAPSDDIAANPDQGSVYVFVRSGVTWTQQQKLTASDGAVGDQFGFSVGITGDTIVVGAPNDSVGPNFYQGSAYVFVRSGTAWTQQQKLTASDGAVFDLFGYSVAISGDTVVVGAVNGSNQGSAYVFVRSGTTWTQQQKLIAGDGGSGDQFGFAVAISGDTVVAGAVHDVIVSNQDQGSAYVFVRSGATWSLQQKLIVSDGLTFDQFGVSVAISGDTIVVGAQADDVTVADQGSAYVYVRTGTTWNLQQTLSASDAGVTDLFGFSVAISGDTIVVGAHWDDVGTNTNQGSAYVFVRSGIGWTERQKLTASDGAANDEFGWSVAMSGDTVVVGAYLDDVVPNTDQGSAYVFFTGCNTSPTLAAGNQIRQKGSAATSATIAAVDDGQDGIGYLTVSVVSAPTGISITNLTNSNGVITAQFAALCNATLGNNSVLLRVQDSDGALGDVTLYVNVTANSDPVVGAYPDASVLASNGTTVMPSFAPSDNGSIVQIIATSPTYSGGLSVNSDSGVVTISNARPAGSHIITITAIDNCGSGASQAFLLTVTCQSITVNPSTIPGGTAGSAYTQTFTQTGGIAPVAFSLSGMLPTGLSFTAGTATLSGTPTQVGSFPITVTSTDRNSCASSRNYTLVAGAMMLVWNGSASSDWNSASNWTPNAVPTTFNDVLIPTAGVTNQPTISAGSSSINAMTIQSSRVLTINSSLQLSTAADVTSAGTITGTGKLAVSGAAFTQNGTVSVNSVEFSAGAHALTGGGAFASGITTVLSGASVTLTSNHSISVMVINSGGSFDATNRALTLTGAGTPIFNSGVFTAIGSTIIYQGSVSQVITANIAYQNLTINNGAGLSLAGDTTVNGQLNLMTDLSTGSFP